MEKSLDLDRRLLERSAKVYEGYARLLEQESSSDDRPGEVDIVRSSSLVLAAVYRALIGDSRAISLFAQAADEYHDLDRPFYVALAICANYKRLMLNHVRRRVRHEPAFDPRTLDPETLLYDLLATMDAVGREWRDEYADEIAAEAKELFPRLLDRGSDLRSLPVGRLELPLQLYILVGRGVEDAVVGEDRELVGLRVALVEYLQRVDEIVGRAMTDRFHWSRLRSSVLPLEPEVLATCLAVDKVSRRRMDRHVASFVSETDLTAGQRVPAQAAANMALWHQS